MRKNLYQAKDNVGRALVGPIFAERDDAPAVRTFTDAFRDERTMFYSHPEDFDLLCLGEYDDSDGTMLVGTGEYPRVVVTGRAIVAKSKEASNESE